MSRNGEMVAGKTSREIYEAAMAAREKLRLGLEGRLAIGPEWLLEKLVRPIYGVDIDIVEDNALPDSYAAFVPADRVLKIRESVLRKAESEDHDALFTIFHEIGHICLHSDQVFYRHNPSRRATKHNDPEWQADRFALEFSVDRQELIDRYQHDLASASNYFRLPQAKLRIFLAELKGEGLIVPTNKELGMEEFQQRAFEF